MQAFFQLARCKNNSNHIPRLGEIFLYQKDGNNWDIKVGDGITEAKDLPTLYDIHERVSKLEQEIQKLKQTKNG